MPMPHALPLLRMLRGVTVAGLLLSLFLAPNSLLLVDALDGPVPHRLDMAVSEIKDARGPIDEALVQRVFETICQAGIRHPKIVMRQAILETGWFRSPFLMTRNNLFAFRRGHYLRFDRFEHSVLFYKAWQERNMRVAADDYYLFLDQIPYGSPDYTEHLRKIPWNKDCS
jgi:hypothetical protein